jgi:hypothetical protein
MNTVTRKARIWLSAGAVAAAGALAAGVALAAPAGAAQADSTIHYSFRTIDNNKDVTFNQLLGIDDDGVIAGYFGSGTLPAHPNKGYVLLPRYHQSDYINENFPHSVQTQVTGLNNVGNTVGFWANSAGANFGFYTTGRHFHEVNFPTVHNASPQVDQLLGINNHGVAVGFFVNNANLQRGFEYNIHTHKFSRVFTHDHGQGPSLQAAAINNAGVIAGSFVTKGGVTDGFVLAGRRFTKLAVPGATMTQAFGINDSGRVVGAYTVGSGSNAKSYGFTWKRGQGFRTVNDPNGVGQTVINGINDHGDLVGFYTDSQGNVDGFLAKP